MYYKGFSHYNNVAKLGKHLANRIGYVNNMVYIVGKSLAGAKFIDLGWDKAIIGEAIIYEKIDIVFVKGVLMTISEAKEAFLINGKSIILVEGVVTELKESYAILSDGKNELIVSGLTNIKVDEWIYIRGEIFDINSIRSFDLLR